MQMICRTIRTHNGTKIMTPACLLPTTPARPPPKTSQDGKISSHHTTFTSVAHIHIQGSYLPHIHGSYLPHIQGSHLSHIQGSYLPHIQGSHLPHIQGSYLPHIQGSLKIKIPSNILIKLIL